MALLDRCIWLPAQDGAGDFQESVAVTGYQTMESAGAVDGQIYSYAAQTVAGNGAITAWEVGQGAWTAATRTLARTTILYSSFSGSKCNFDHPPQVMITALAEDLAPSANSNLTFSVPSQFSTIQAAVNAAAVFDYRGIYTLAISVADGTYGPVTLPPLRNYPEGQSPTLTGNITTPANCIIASAAGDALNTGWYVSWSVTGFRLKSTSGADCDLNVMNFSVVNLGVADFAGNFNLIKAHGHSSVFFNANVTSSTSSASTAMTAFYHGGIINDGFIWTFSNTPSFSNAIAISTDNSIIGMGTYSGTVTGTRMIISNHSIIEFTGSRSSFPGNGICNIDGTSWFAGDTVAAIGQYKVTSGTYSRDAVVLSDAAGNLQGDYGVTFSGNWNFQNNAFANAFGSNLSSSGKVNFALGATGNNFGSMGIQAAQAWNLGSSADAANTSTVALVWDANNNVAAGGGAVATNATNGFLYIPTCPGTPTGAPTAYTGFVPMVFDTTDNKLYVYNGAWKAVALA